MKSAKAPRAIEKKLDDIEGKLHLFGRHFAATLAVVEIKSEL